MGVTNIGQVRGPDKTRNNEMSDVHVSRNMLRIIAANYAEVNDGAMFGFTDLTSVDPAQEISYLVRVNSHALHLVGFAFHADQEPTEVAMYESPYIDPSSAGVPITPVNRNRVLADKQFDATILRNPSTDVNSLGALLDRRMNYVGIGGGLAGVKPTDESVAVSDAGWVLAPGMDYLVVMHNRSGNAATVNARFAGYLED